VTAIGLNTNDGSRTKKNLPQPLPNQQQPLTNKHQPLHQHADKDEEQEDDLDEDDDEDGSKTMNLPPFNLRGYEVRSNTLGSDMTQRCCVIAS
jgi:hypothetical protein